MAILNLFWVFIMCSFLLELFHPYRIMMLSSLSSNSMNLLRRGKGEQNITYKRKKNDLHLNLLFSVSYFKYVEVFLYILICQVA